MEKRIFYILIGAIVLVLIALSVVGALVILPKVTSANPIPTPTPTVTAVPTSSSQSNTTAKILKQYAREIKKQIATGLHLTPSELTIQLQSGKTLSDIATAQNVSTVQLQTIVANALRSGLQPAIDGGTLTQQQVDKLVKRYQNNPPLLDRVLGGKASPQATPTSTSNQ